MYHFEIIEETSPEWDEIILKTEHDFHHTAYFHSIDNDFPCYLLYFGIADSFIALPIVLRPVEDTVFFDITSVYGYAGPVVRLENESVKDELFSFFRKRFREYCNENNIVSVFSRLHPLLNQREVLQGMGEIADLNKTVSIDLTMPPEHQRTAYRKSLKSELNQLRRKSYTVSEAKSEEEIEEFIKIYHQTMDRVHADPMYYFSTEYFYSFLNNSTFDTSLLVAKDGDKVIAGAIFTNTGTIMQYHLAGTAEEYIRETPMKLILDEARLRGNDSTAISLHLGGGVGGSDDDSLFRFKSAFSKDFKQFSVWKYIVNEDAYRNLSKGKPESNFFPLYRIPEKTE